MDRNEEFKQYIIDGYNFQGKSIILGTAILDHQPVDGALVKIPLRMMNRHGLVAGATGTGKTKTLQGIVEQLSDNGIGVLIMDIKGDVSGIAMPGTPGQKIDERMQKIGKEWKAKGYPVELMSISGESGIRLRATVSEFGPVLFSKILELNDIQEGVVSLVFKYADDKKLALLDLKDFRKTLNYLAGEGKKEIEGEYGTISTASAGTILRKIIEIEEQGADVFFGERSFDVADLTRINDRGQGYINILRLTDIQSRPKLFSTFMLSLLAEVYNSFPETGDKEDPKLVIIIDEAHLIFDEASKNLLEQIQTIVKLIRSKGVGIFFCTQLPTDIPAEVLSQLGLKVQHALRAFTANDRKAIKLTSENYPTTNYYKTDELLTDLGIGEAIVSALNEKGSPTPLAHTLLVAPQSRMDILTPDEMQVITQASLLAKKYNEQVDRESAYEILNKKMEESAELAEKEKQLAEEEKKVKQQERERKVKEKKSPPLIDKTTQHQITRTMINVLERGILGFLKRR
ncbi:MAG: helicase HerA-like domain-containing protein [Chitinophagales bacterium]